MLVFSNSLIATMFVRQDYGITGYILSIVYICILIHVCSKSLTSDIHFWETKNPSSSVTDNPFFKLKVELQLLTVLNGSLRRVI